MNRLDWIRLSMRTEEVEDGGKRRGRGVVMHRVGECTVQERRQIKEQSK